MLKQKNNDALINHPETGRQKLQLLILLIPAVILIAAGLLGLIWTGLAPKKKELSTDIASKTVPVTFQTENCQLTIPASHLVLNWPERIGAGQTGSIHLRLSSANQQQIQISCPGGKNPQLMLSSRIELPGNFLDPAEELQQPITSGEEKQFHWKLSIPYETNINGKIWISFLIEDETGEIIDTWPLTIRDIPIQAIALWGLSASKIQALSAIIISIGILLILGNALIRKQSRKKQFRNQSIRNK